MLDNVKGISVGESRMPQFCSLWKSLKVMKLVSLHLQLTTFFRFAHMYIGLGNKVVSVLAT